MCKNEKIQFIDKIVSLFEKFCPSMSSSVLYWVACQFALESNFGRSQRAVMNHNLCGMKIPAVRPSLNTAVTGVFSKFDSDEDCVIDYVYLLCYNKFNPFQLTDLDLFRLKLKACKYCPDDDYLDKVNSLFNQFS